VLGEPLVQVVGIGFGKPPALALGARRDRGQFLGTLGQDGAVALAQGLAGGCAQNLGLAAIDFVAGLLQQGFQQARPAGYAPHRITSRSATTALWSPSA